MVKILRLKICQNISRMLLNLPKQILCTIYYVEFNAMENGNCKLPFYSDIFTCNNYFCNNYIVMIILPIHIHFLYLNIIHRIMISNVIDNQFLMLNILNPIRYLYCII